MLKTKSCSIEANHKVQSSRYKVQGSKFKYDKLRFKKDKGDYI